MGYFDFFESTSLTGSYFRKTEDGKTIFYPYGIVSSGYIIPEDKKVQIKQFLKRYNMIVFVIITTAVILFKLYGLVLYPLLVPFYSIKFKQILSRSEKIQAKLQLKEVTKNKAISMGVGVSIFVFIASLLMTSASIWCIFLSGAKRSGIIGTLFFGSFFVYSIFLVRYSIKFKKEKR